MGKNKLRKFREVDRFENVLEMTDFDTENEKPVGRWNEEIFEAKQPITLELACGKGEYTVALAERFPERNFIGVDIKGARIWNGAKRALDADMENVRFLRTPIDHLASYFAKDEISEIWITFPDPFLRRSKRLKRLTSPKFLEIYKSVMKPEGWINLKTDSRELYDYTLEVIEATECPLVDQVPDVYAERPDDEILTIKTAFERKHLERGRTITYLKFGLPQKRLANPKMVG